jgi:hypothetical protein
MASYNPSDRDKKRQQEETERVLKDLLQKPANRICADCCAKGRQDDFIAQHKGPCVNCDLPRSTMGFLQLGCLLVHSMRRFTSQDRGSCHQDQVSDIGHMDQ